MASQNLVNLNNVNLPSGDTPFGPFAVPNGLAGFQIIMARCTTATPTIWPNAATTAEVHFQFSWDGGVTWSDPNANMAGPVGGGIQSGRSGEMASWISQWRFNPAAPTHLQGFVRVTNGPLRTSVQVIAIT